MREGERKRRGEEYDKRRAERGRLEGWQREGREKDEGIVE